jgi:D-methionine transport system substrate-binding protein
MMKKAMAIRKMLLPLLLVVGVLFSGCAKDNTAAGGDKTITFVAQNYKLYEDTTKILAEEVGKLGYKLDYKFLADNTQINEAVESGEAFANYHQHIAFLTEFNQVHNTHLYPAFEVFTDRAGLFSKKYKSIDTLPDGATISIPVDPGNNFRTFVMLADAGLIKLKDGVEPAKVTIKDVVDNPHHFKFTEVDYTMLSRAIEDADAGFLYATVAAEINLDFNKDSLLKENKKNQSPDVITVLEKNKDSEKTKILKKAYQTDRMKQAFKDAYQGREILLPGW